MASLHLYHETTIHLNSCVLIQPGTDNKISSHLLKKEVHIDKFMYFYC
jgi:hypothetical protein